MQSQMQVASRMGQIETDHAAPRMTSPRYPRHIECLTRRIIHSSQQDQCDLIP